MRKTIWTASLLATLFAATQGLAQTNSGGSGSSSSKWDGALGQNPVWEPAWTEMLAYTDALTTSPWVASANVSAAASSTPDPFGSATSKAWTLTQTAAYQPYYQGNTIVSGTSTYNCNAFVYAPSSTQTDIQIRLTLSGGTLEDVRAVFNPNTGAVSGSGSPTAVGDNPIVGAPGWWRVWVVEADNNSGNTLASCQIIPSVLTASAVVTVARPNLYKSTYLNSTGEPFSAVTETSGNASVLQGLNAGH